jgi:signal transduction histidine kinase
MDPTADCPLAATLALRLRGARDELTRRWLDRISGRVELPPNRVFPTEQLLDHVPILIDGIADYLEDPANVVAADVPVIAKAMELGELRFSQGFDEHELLKEYELLGGVLFGFLSRTADEIEAPCTKGQLLACAHRLFSAITMVQQATATQYAMRMKARIHEREDRLRGFNRALTHELKNRIGAAVGAAGLLSELADLDLTRRQQLIGVVLRNVGSMRGVLDNLLELSRLGIMDARHHRHVTLPQAVAEAARQLRDAAHDQGVEIRVGDLPPIEVNAAAVELSLSNLLSNAIKYADRSKSDRWVAVDATVDEEVRGENRLTIKVRDNGIGVPKEGRTHLYERFYRAHATSKPDIEGTGLGLSLVRDTIEALGGETWAEFAPEGGSVFAFSLPCRRGEDDVALDSGDGSASPT